jgi:hypothetical protein
MGCKQDEYLKVWKASLRELLGWSEDRISEWIKQFQQDLRDLEFGFVRQDALAYVIPELILTDLKNGLSHQDWGDLQLKIRFAITGDPSWTIMNNLPSDQILPPAEWWKQREESRLLGEKKGQILTNSNLDYFDWESARRRVKAVLEEFALDRTDLQEQRAANRRKEQEYYIKHWKVVLTKLLGWTEEQVLKWAKQFEKEMSNTYAFFYREEPVYYSVPLFVPQKAHTCLSPRDFQKLLEKIQFAIGRNPRTVSFENLCEESSPSEQSYRILEAIRLAQQRGEILAPINFDYYDWEGAKERIKAVLKEYGLEPDW